MVSSALINRSRLLALGGVLAAILIVVAATFSGHSVFAQETIPVPTPEATPEATPTATLEPTPEATPEPTPEATPEPTPEAMPEPTPEATPEPTPEATPEPTPEATPEPTPEATPEPTLAATPEPTPEATPEPTPEATAEATAEPTTEKSTETGESTPPQTAKQVQRQANRPDAPGNLSAVRVTSSTQMKPALDVTWTTPAANGTTITQYDVYYGTDKKNMTKYSGKVGPAATSLRLTDLTAGATYHVRVLAFAGNDGNNGVAGVHADTTGKTNTPPTTTTTYIAVQDIEWGDTIVDPNPMSDFFNDADSDTLTYSISSQYPGIVSAWVDGDPGLYFAVKAVNPASSSITYDARDGYGGYASRTVKLTGVANPTRSVMENSPAGTLVGDPVAGTLYGEALAHSLHGEATSYFVISTATGQISVKQGTSLDYETKSSYTGQVRWYVQNQLAVANLTINVGDIAPDKPAAPTVTRTEFNSKSAPALDVTWTAPNANGTTITGYGAQYRVKVAEGETENAWTAYSGTLGASARTLNLADLDEGATYEVQVRAHSDEGSGPWSDAVEGTANTRPRTTTTSISATTIPWGETREYDLAASGAAHFEDADGDTLTYSASATYSCIIGVSFSGSVLSITPLNPAPSFILYEVTDSYGGRASRTAKITGSGNVTREVAENSAAGTNVGAPITASPCGTEYISYGFVGEAATSGKFAIDHETGQISVAEGATLDYETKSSYTGQVEWVVHGDQDVSTNVTINVTDVGAAKPDAPALTRTTFSEPSKPALDVTWTAAAANGGATITGYEAQYRKKVADGEEANAWTLYEYEDPDNPGTKISKLSASTTSIKLPGLETGATYESQVRGISSEEGAGPWSDIGEGTANTPPKLTANGTHNFTMPWGSTSAAHAVVSHFADADNDTLSYSVSTEYPGVISGWIHATHHVLLKALNPGVSAVNYGVHDGYGGYAFRTFTVTSVANETRSVAENSPAGTAVGGPVTGTPYTGETLSYSLTGAAADSFSIDSATGQISVKQGATLDYETKSSYTGKVNWTVQEQAAVVNLTINVTDIEASAPNAPTLTRTQFSVPTSPALDVTWTAPAADGVTITGYEAQYREKVADGEEANAWTLYTYEDPDNAGTQISKLPATATSINLAGLDAGTTFESQVRALTQLEGEGPWSDAGEGRANRAPNTNSLHLVDYSSGWGNLYGVPVPKFFEDADNDTLTYSTSSTNQGVINVWMSGNELKFSMLNPGTATITYGAHDPYGGYVSRTVDYTTTANLTRSVPENSVAGTSVGDAVRGKPFPTGTVYTHTLSGDAADSGAFVIDATTGQISVKQGATLDYETKSSYTGKVEWTVQGQAAVANVTINVTDREAGKPDAPTVTRTEFSEPTDPALDITWAAPAANGTTITGYEAQYRIKVADGETENSWTLYTYEDPDNAGAQISKLPATTTSINLPGLDAGTTFEAQVRALTSLEGEGPWSDTGEGTANRPPAWNGVVFVGSDPLKWGTTWIIENSLADHFADADGDTLTYSASSEYVGIINAWVEGSHPKLRVLNPAASTVTFKAQDPYGGVSDTFSHKYVGSANVTRTVRENSPANTMLGDRVQGRPYNGLALTYKLTGEPVDSGHFYIKPLGRIRVKSGANLDYETKSTYSGKVEYTIQGQPAAINVTINVIDLEAGKPDAPTVTRTTFSEQSNPALDIGWTAPDANGTTITGYEAQYRIKVADGETENSWTLYEYEDPDNAGTQISKLSTTTTSINLPDLDAGATYEVQVRALTSLEGEGPWSDAGEGTANRPPNGTSAQFPVGGPSLIDAGNGNQIGGHFEDADSDTLIYSASSAHPGMFTVALTGDNSDTLALTAVNPASTTITYGAHDGYGGYTSRSFTVTGNRSETLSVAENSAAGTAVGDPITGTPYNGETLSYSLTGAAADAFVIDSATGQISVKQGATIDYETTNSYAGTVQYAVQGQTATVSVTISVTDLTAPTQPDAPTLAQSATDPTTILDVSWTAPDTSGGLPITAFEAQYRVKAAEDETTNAWKLYLYDDPANPGTQISKLAATTTSIELTGLTKNTTYEVQVRAYNVEGASVWSPTGEGDCNPDNSRPQFSTQAKSRTVEENSPAGTTVGAPVTATDPEGHTLTYSLKSPSSLFNLNSTTGQITVAKGASLDYESQRSYTVVVQASDGFSVIGIDDGHIVDAEITVRINVTNVGEPPPKPAAPSVARSSSSPTSTLNVTWSAPDMTGKPAITGYALLYKKAAGSLWTELSLNGLQTRATLTGLQAGTAYHVSIRAVNKDGSSQRSESGLGSTAGSTSPTPPTTPRPPSAPTAPEPTPISTPTGPTTTPTPPGPTSTPTPPGPTSTPAPPEPTFTPTPPGPSPTPTPPEPTPIPPTPPELPSTPTPEPTPTPLTAPEPTTTPTPDPTATPTQPETPTPPTPSEPTSTPTPEPTPVPTLEATPARTPQSAPAPTPQPTPDSTIGSTPEIAPTHEPAVNSRHETTSDSTPVPTPNPTTGSTPEPTLSSTPAPTREPTDDSTPAPTAEPTSKPKAEPTPEPAPEPASEPEPRVIAPALTYKQEAVATDSIIDQIFVFNGPGGVAYAQGAPNVPNRVPYRNARAPP